MIRNRWVLAAIGVLSLFAVSADAAIVYLRDGGELQGTVVSSTSSSVELRTSEGTVRIPTSKISRIDYAQAAPRPEAPAQYPPPQTPSAYPPPRQSRISRWRR